MTLLNKIRKENKKNKIFKIKRNKERKKRFGLIYSPKSCLNKGNAFGNCSKNLKNNVFGNSLPLGV